MSTEIRAFTLAELGARAPGSDAMFQPGLGYVHTQTGIRVTPVLHGDLIAMDFQSELSGQVAQMKIIIRDGQTLAMRLPRHGAKDVTVIFITPQIVRRN